MGERDRFVELDLEHTRFRIIPGEGIDVGKYAGSGDFLYPNNDLDSLSIDYADIQKSSH